MSGPLSNRLQSLDEFMPDDIGQVLRFHFIKISLHDEPQALCTVRTKDRAMKTGFCCWTMFQHTNRAKESCRPDWDHFIGKYHSTPAPAASSIAMVKTYYLKRSQWRYIDDLNEILYVVRFNRIKHGDEMIDDALAFALIKHGILAIQCPWRIFRAVPNAQEAAGAM